MTRRRPHLLLLATAAMVPAILALAGSPDAKATAQVPPQLAGQWAIPWQGGTEYLNLAGPRFMFFFNDPSGQPPRGVVSVTGSQITFYRSQYCTGTGTYQWSLSGRGLTFVQAAGSSDPCPREAVLTSSIWTGQ